MENRWRQKGDFNNSREVSRRRSRKKKPPRCSWQPAVPSWEKTFCKVVGSLDWEIILDMKKFVHLYDNIVKWNDSAGEEAFHNAKKRFLAKIHGLPCDISLPNPDLYIDEVDWDSEVDPELFLDLEREYSIPNTSENHETVVIFGDSLYCNEAFFSTGWGDNEENLKKAINISNNPECPWEKSLCISKQTANENGWGEAIQSTFPLDEGGGTVGDIVYCNEAFISTGWGDNEENLKKATKFSNNPECPWEKSLCINKQTANENGWGEAVQSTFPLDEGGGTVGDIVYCNEAFMSTGWGDNEENLNKATNFSNYPENPWEKSFCINKQTANENGWGEAVQSTFPLDEGGGTVGDIVYCNEAFMSTGWGDNEENLKKATNFSNYPESPWEKSFCINKQTANENGWGEAVQSTRLLDEGGGTVGDIGWGDGWGNTWFPNQYDYNVNEPKEIKGPDKIQGTWDVNNGKKEATYGFAPRNNTSRFHGNDNKGSHKWRNGKGNKRETSLYENSTTNKKLPSRCWKPLSSCGPLSYHASGEAGQTWNLDKPIL